MLVGLLLWRLLSEMAEEEGEGRMVAEEGEGGRGGGGALNLSKYYFTICIWVNYE